MELGEKLANLRRARGMSQQEAAAALGVARQTVSNWESGASAPALDKARDVAQLYRVSIADLVDGAVGVAAPGVPTVAEPERDLHVLRSLVGRACYVVDAEGALWPDYAKRRAVRVLDVTADWARVAHDRPGAWRQGGERVVELLDMGSVSGFALAMDPAGGMADVLSTHGVSASDAAEGDGGEVGCR